MPTTKSLLHLLLISALLAAWGCKNDEVLCATASDCFRGEVCLNGQCVLEATDIPDAGGGESPDTDTDDTSASSPDVDAFPDAGDDNSGHEGPRILQLVAGEDNTCLLLESGEVWCWGNNKEGNLGANPSSLPLSRVPVKVDFEAPARQIASSIATTCATRADGSLHCVGSSLGVGLLGTANLAIESSASPIRVDISDVKSVSSGAFHLCAIDQDSRLKCWGTNVGGECGQNPNEFLAVHTPTEVHGIGGAKLVAMGTFHTCAVTHQNALKCWGTNDDEVFTLEGPDTHVPQESGFFGGGPAIKALASGFAFACVLTELNLLCWGRNESGQLGRDPEGLSSTRTPQPIDALSDATAISVGNDHACALQAGEVWCWGSNNSGQLGNGTTTNSHVPTRVAGLAGVVHVSAGGSHTCAVTDGQEVYCWGHNSNGQLGNNSASPILREPVRVAATWN